MSVDPSQSTPQQGPPEADEARAKRVAKNERRARSDLWSAVWEGSQFMSYDEIRKFVEGVIGEIENDAP